MKIVMFDEGAVMHPKRLQCQRGPRQCSRREMAEVCSDPHLEAIRAVVGEEMERRRRVHDLEYRMGLLTMRMREDMPRLRPIDPYEYRNHEEKLSMALGDAQREAKAARARSIAADTCPTIGGA